MTGKVKAVQTTTSWTPELAQVHVTGPTSPLPPRNKDQSADAAKSLSYFFQSLFGGVQGNVPKFEKLWRIKVQLSEV